MNSRESRIERWIAKQKMGATFKTAELAKELNYDPKTVGRIIGKQPNILGHHIRGSCHIWEVVAT